MRLFLCPGQYLSFTQPLIQIAQGHSTLSETDSWIVITTQVAWQTLRRPFPCIVKPLNFDQTLIQIAHIHSTALAMHS
jgi:hypothetical protein